MRVERLEDLDDAARRELCAFVLVEPNELAGEAEIERDLPKQQPLKLERLHRGPATGAVHAARVRGEAPRYSRRALRTETNFVRELSLGSGTTLRGPRAPLRHGRWPAFSRSRKSPPAKRSRPSASEATNSRWRLRRPSRQG